MQTASDSVRLPEGYVKLNYVEATGSQYIITDYIPTLDKPSKIIADFQYTVKRESGTGRLFGKANNTTNRGSFQFGLDGTNNAWFFFRSSGMANLGQQNAGIRFGNPDLERHIFCFEYQKSVTVDGISYEETLEQASYHDWRGDNTKGNEFAIFATQRGGELYSGSEASAKLYSLKLYEGDELVRDFVPAQNTYTGEIGLFEVVLGNFFVNGTSTPLLGG